MRLLLIILISWAWWTGLHAQYALHLYVATDGSTAYSSIQDAIDATKAFPAARVTIHIKSGVYQEKVKVHAWNDQLTLKGEDAATTIIRWDDYFDRIDRGRNSTFHTPTLLVQGDNFRAEDLTIENFAGPVGQAIALAVEADRCQVVRCRLLGNQDTLYAAGTNSRQLYQECYIEGTTDFIFGAATALFVKCTIHSKANSFITAASTPAHVPYGFVFSECLLTAAPGIDQVYLGRPWRDFAKTVFLNSEFGAHILPAGWDNWGNTAKERTAYYAEYANTGPGADTHKRAEWSRQLSKRQAKKYQQEKVLQPVRALPVSF